MTAGSQRRSARLSASAAAARPAWGWRWRSLWRSRRAFARAVLLASRPVRRLDGSRAVLPRRVRSTPWPAAIDCGDPHPCPGAGWNRLWSAARDREPLAEHKRLEEGVPENPVRIEGLKQRAEVWQTLVARLQCRRRDREQLAPMGSRVERRQPLLDARQQLLHALPVVSPGKVQRYAIASVERAHPHAVRRDRPHLRHLQERRDVAANVGDRPHRGRRLRAGQAVLALQLPAVAPPAR